MESKQIQSAEIERKNLANKTAYPIASNLEKWTILRKYRFYMIKEDNEMDILGKWPLYSHTDAACLVSMHLIPFLY